MSSLVGILNSILAHSLIITWHMQPPVSHFSQQYTCMACEATHCASTWPASPCTGHHCERSDEEALVKGAEPLRLTTGPPKLLPKGSSALKSFMANESPVCVYIIYCKHTHCSCV